MEFTREEKFGRDLGDCLSGYGGMEYDTVGDRLNVPYCFVRIEKEVISNSL